MNEQSLQINIKSSFLDRERQLTITSEFIEYDDTDRVSEKPTRLLNSDIVAFRYGIKWIRGYQFIIGRIYCIDIKAKEDKIMKLRLKSLYGINKKRLTAKYLNIIDALFENAFDKVSEQYMEKFANSMEFEILGITFKPSGVYFKEKNVSIEWTDVGTKFYTTYYAIFSKSRPDIYKTFEFLTDWNTAVIYSVSRQILLGKNLFSEN